MIGIIFKSHLEELQTMSVLMPGLEESINFVKTRLFWGSTYSPLVRGGTNKKLVSQHENYENLTGSKTQFLIHIACCTNWPWNLFQ